MLGPCVHCVAFCSVGPRKGRYSVLEVSQTISDCLKNVFADVFSLCCSKGPVVTPRVTAFACCLILRVSETQGACSYKIVILALMSIETKFWS